jgi:hypothetical protein
MNFRTGILCICIIPATWSLPSLMRCGGFRKPFQESPRSHYSGESLRLVVGQAASVTVQKLQLFTLPPPIIQSFFLEQLQQEGQAPQSAWTMLFSCPQVQHLIASTGWVKSDSEVMMEAGTIHVLVGRPPICNRGHVYCTCKDSGN